MDRITTTIKREWLSQIVARTKKIEYREMKQYWHIRLGRVATPFELRLINGMSKKAPEVTVLIKKVRKNRKERLYELHIGKIISVKNWNIKKERSTRGLPKNL